MCINITLPDSSVRFVRLVNFIHVKLEKAAVTLGNGSWSNVWYGSKVKVGKMIWNIEKDLVVKSL